MLESTFDDSFDLTFKQLYKYMSGVCDIAKKNLGVVSCNKLPGLPKTIITTPIGFVIPAATANDPEALETFLLAAILAGTGIRIYKWADFTNFTDQSQEASYQDTPLALTKIKDGNYRFLFEISQSMCYHKAMYTHRANTGRVFIIDVNNNMLGTFKANGDVIGLKIQMLDTQKLKFSDGSSIATTSPLLVALADNLEIDKNGALMDASFIGNLNSIIDVQMTVVGTPIATKIVVKVVAECDQTPINGLIVGDFILKKTDGTSQTITSVTEVDGVYTLNGTGLLTGTLTLAAADDLSISPYEQPAPIVITIA